MLQQTFETLDERVLKLETELGIGISSENSSENSSDNATGIKLPNLEDTIVAQLGRLQFKVKQILQSNEVFKNMPKVFQEYQNELDSTLRRKIYEKMTSLDIVTEAEKEERISARLGTILSYINSILELKNMEFPSISGALFKALDMLFLQANVTRIEALVQTYEVLVAKNLLVLYMFEAFMKKEDEYWAATEAKMNSLNAELRSISEDSVVVDSDRL